MLYKYVYVEFMTINRLAQINIFFDAIRNMYLIRINQHMSSSTPRPQKDIRYDTGKIRNMCTN